MTQFKPHTITAHNFAVASENRMHADDTAAAYGFRGGLVPGVSLYAYMTVPVVEALGREFLARGGMQGKFLKPVYDGEPVRATARVNQETPIRIACELHNADGVLCAVGEASLPDTPSALDLARYPAAALPPRDQRVQPSIAALPAGKTLGSLALTVADFATVEGESGAPFVDDVRDPLPIYRGRDAACHPAWVVAKANRLLMENVALGPWIHTASVTQHYALPEPNEPLSLRGTVLESYEKRGHEFVVLDLALLGRDDRSLAHVTHTAIVRPARVNA